MRALAVMVMLLVAAGPCAAAEVVVAVAANFAAPMQRIAAAFERDTGHRAVLAVGSTGKFHAQIRNGAPFQVLLSADEATAERLEREGFGVPGTRFTYATGRLVLWSRTPGVVDERGEVLRTGGQARLALADPRVAPYGAAALEALDRLGVLARWRPRLVQGESIAQAHQFVATGNAPLGLVALSQVWSDGRIAQGSGWIVPAQLHAPIRQDALLLAPGRGQPAAAELMRYLRGDRARAIVESFGYSS